MELCEGCWQDLPRNTRCCSRCAIPLSQPGVCGRCQRDPPAFDGAFVPFLYRAPFDHWLPALKFHGELSLARLLGQLLATEWLLRAGSSPLDVTGPLIPVPLHRSRLRERGYNQAREIAAAAGPLLGQRLSPLVKRIRATAPQTELKAAQRTRNVRHSFSTSGPVPDHLLLVDDVLTTGATAAEVARTLKRAQAVRVGVMALARVLPPGSG